MSKEHDAMAAVRLAKRAKKPINTREYLNTASALANDILEGLRPVIEAAPDGILDRDTRETLKLAMETLKTCRELQLKSKALDHQIRLSALEQGPAAGPLAGPKQLEAVDTGTLLALVAAKGDKKE